MYDAAEFDALSEKYEKLNWRIVSKPGGATVKPDEFYPLYGQATLLLQGSFGLAGGSDQDFSEMDMCRLHMQALKGDNTAERPMWAEKGGLDFDGRARWDAWTAVKGTQPEKAKLNFVRITFILFLLTFSTKRIYIQLELLLPTQLLNSIV